MDAHCTIQRPGKEPLMLELSSKTNLLEENDYRDRQQELKPSLKSFQYEQSKFILANQTAQHPTYTQVKMKVLNLLTRKHVVVE